MDTLAAMESRPTGADDRPTADITVLDTKIVTYPFADWDELQTAAAAVQASAAAGVGCGSGDGSGDGNGSQRGSWFSDPRPERFRSQTVCGTSSSHSGGSGGVAARAVVGQFLGIATAGKARNDSHGGSPAQSNAGDDLSQSRKRKRRKKKKRKQKTRDSTRRDGGGGGGPAPSPRVRATAVAKATAMAKAKALRGGAGFGRFSGW